MRLLNDALEEPRPAVSADEAARLLKERYGVSGEFTPLHGERDLNFRVVADSGEAYFYKLQNPADGADVVDMQTKALEHVRGVDPSLPVVRVLPALDGSQFFPAEAEDGRISFLRLFPFMEGHNAAAEELDEPALAEWGRTTARLGRALRGYFHPAAGYPIQWDIRRAAALRPLLGRLPGDHRQAVEAVLERFEKKVAPLLPSLRAQVVHNDMSRANLLVDGEGSITAITDFGDMTHTSLVCDLAVAVADVLDGRDGSLELAEAMVRGYAEVTPLEDEETGILADLVATRCATSVVLTTWQVQAVPAAPGFAAGALIMLRQLLDEGIEVFGRRLACAAARGAVRQSRLPYRRVATAELLERRRRSLGPLSLSYDEPLHLVRGEGVFLFGADGSRYLDAYNNVPVVGHCHPKVVEAVAAQLRLLNTNTRYLQEASTELAERLVASVPDGLDRVLFVNSGSEANDVAVRICSHATGRRGLVVTRFAYHGLTEATTWLSPEEWSEAARRPPTHVRLVAPPASGRQCEVASAIEELAAEGEAISAMFVDPAFTSDGILGPAHDWLRQAAAAVRAGGGLFVGDEVQAGFGRTGESLWSLQPSGVEPEIMTLGKPMGNGFPVAAVIARSDVVDSFIEETGYFSTFGGNTAACTAALAVLDVIEEEGLIEHAKSVGVYLDSSLRDVMSRHEVARSLRSFGLIAGLELAGPAGSEPSRLADHVANRMRGLGVLVGTTGPAGSVLKIRPPLVVEREHVDLLCERLDESLGCAESEL